MENQPLSPEEKITLLRIARQALEDSVSGRRLAALDLQQFSENLQSPGASFVTLTVHGALRGCIGALEAYQPLVLDVQEHAMAAALEDYRFARVIPTELPGIEIEVSRLTQPIPLEYKDAADLISKLRPGKDGVIIRDGAHRATFLPQVWQQVPEPGMFLDQLCYKMGSMPETWRRGHPLIFTYEVDEFHE